MAEVLAELAVVTLHDGRQFVPRVCGGPLENVWQGWIEFAAVDGSGVVRTPRETTQPDRTALAYWATGLSPTYLEGAIARALSPRVAARESVSAVPAFEEPAPSIVTPPRTTVARAVSDSVLDPFSVYQSGERVLLQELEALASWHLINIIRAYGLSHADVATLEATPHAALVSLILVAVRARSEIPARP